MLNVFDIYFATLVGMQEHPGFNRENATARTLDECAELAIAMLEIRKDKMERIQCLFSQQE